MSDADDLEVGRIEWTGDDLSLVEAVLSPSAPSAPGEPPRWLDALDGWAMLTIIEGPRAEAIAARLEGERAPDGARWIVFSPLPDADGEFAEAPCRALVHALRDALDDDHLAVVCVDRGAVGASGLLGPVAERGAALYRRHREARGLHLAPEAEQASRAPVIAFPQRARSRWATLSWVGAAAAAVVAGVLWLRAPTPADGPDARIYVMGGAARIERGPATWREADPVTVALEGPAGTHATLLLLDSDSKLVTPVPELVGVRLDGSPAITRLEFDDRPGRERFMVLATRAPVADLAALLERVNAAPAADRAGRLTALRRALQAHPDLSAHRLRLAEEIEHGR